MMDATEHPPDGREILRLETSNSEEMQHTLGRVFYASKISLLRPDAPLQTHVRIATAGSITLGDIALGTDIRFDHQEELGAYHVDIPLAGQLHWRQGGPDVRVSTSARAAVYQPVGKTVLERLTADCRLIALKIDRCGLEAELAGLLDRPIRTPIRLGPELDLSSHTGRSWASLVRMLAADAGDPGGLAHHPVIGRHLRQSVLAGLLLAADHPYRAALACLDGAQLPPRAVRRVVEAVHAQPGRPFTVADLACIAGVSTRALQSGFQRHFGISPMAYLRDIRLTRAHDQLRAGDPVHDSVAAIADQWGFPHVGRFALMYRRKFGVPPSQTLRG